ncbi:MULTISPECIES: F0F1 ATP synthase subunit gamma [unclassified Modestobacter]|uniref:F0F1 ATP synthase subunit gamma n=1 Tax=unclassified Modestobacter TaxID=2643866 RepID=UPI0022AAB20F|nr:MULTISPECIES: F0F1 ATP synthase subunit gamma [unclassified Modestobacter]MCZ2812517.1 F0F1 ATP synthase subunit gamma [Modestobacter sp. VKM Ac-2979]MCZ2822160.1 F0F1 ATP synthase subunit gamma [Modestobacter sp. VKM Ac-2977]MCZ2841407.1 F0F1 ATP synthase subunit gamma [Modestobacter sp. VKM Ac-2980]MCZ2850141.1 F0F1 ATP synthase subunit gamma [Modestobacter sp. VKM Ac-2978]
MAGSLRALRRRIRSTQSTKKIFSAQELIAAARIVRAQARVEASKPYAREITRVLSALAGSASLDHPLLTDRENPRRVAVLVVTSDRGFAGSYNVNVLRRTEELLALLRDEGKEPLLYVVGRKGETYYRFRDRDVEETWSGFSEQPGYENAQDIGRTLIAAFTAGEDDDETGGGADDVLGVDELHIVYTEFRSLLSQVPVANRMAPLVVEEVDELRDDRDAQVEESRSSDITPSYEFEPSPEQLLDALLPKYVTTRIYAALLEAAASESASRRRAMKSASDNAEELAKNLSRQANAARQAEITQEISEIVGGADALVSANADD